MTPPFDGAPAPNNAMPAEEVMARAEAFAPTLRTGLNAPEPPPVANTGTPIWELVIADMQERDRAGRAKYGTPLQAGNGRKPLVDAYQESLDLNVYLRQEIEERADLERHNRIMRLALQMIALQWHDSPWELVTMNRETAKQALRECGN